MRQDVLKRRGESVSYLQQVLDEMKKEIKGFEVRPQQFTMMEETLKAMRDGKKAAIEAPTGTGKSFGYLLPFVAQKLESPEFRITINTYTIALQAQLQKDIEVAKRVYNRIAKRNGMMKTDLHTVILKGNSNYFCEYRYDQIRDEDLTLSLTDEIDNILNEDGVRDKQRFGTLMSPKNWELVQVDGCLKRDCPFRKECTYFQHYSQISSFDIVVANHALFFARFLYSDRFWEPFDFHIFDESHKLERGLLDASTYALSMRIIDGWLFQGVRFAEAMKAPASDIEAWRQMWQNDETYLESKKWFADFQDFFKADKQKKTNTTSAHLDTMKVDPTDIKWWVKRLHEWQKKMYDNMVKDVLEFVPNKDEDKEYQKAQKTWVMNLLNLKSFSDLSNKDDKGELWVDIEYNQPHLKVTPQHIGMIPTPFDRGVLLTSGTISQNGSCQALSKRLNVKLDSDIVLPTPFPLKDQTLVYFDTDINPKAGAFKWKDQMQQKIEQLLQAGEQKTFVLFTSDKVMREMYDRLLPFMYNLSGTKPLQTWLQEKGNVNYNDVIASFRDESVRSILFGTYTYFEGIDLKGKALTQVILTRLPYSPLHPIQDILEKNSGYGHWEAHVRFEQAFGRLVRTATDYGTFSVLDNRVSYLQGFKEIFERDGIPTTTRIEDIFQFYQKR